MIILRYFDLLWVKMPQFFYAHNLQYYKIIFGVWI